MLKSTNTARSNEPLTDSYLVGTKLRMGVFRASDMIRTVRKITVEKFNDIDAISSDSIASDIADMTEVSDVGPPLQSPNELETARSYFNQQAYIPPIWHHYLKTGKHPPFHFEKTSFVNLFSKDVIILFDIYRPPWKPYFTSDVFFYQWLKSLGKGVDLMELPDRFPTIVYIHNFTNHISKHCFKNILDTEKSDTHVINDPLDKNWTKISTTPHLKTIHHILNTYNKINGIKGETVFKISSLQVYRNTEMYHLKLNFNHN